MAYCSWLGVSPLAVDRELLDAVQDAMSSRSAGRFWMDPELRAALSTTNTGGRQTWSANMLAGPRMLSQVAEVPADYGTQAISAAFLQAGATPATGSVGENVAIAEWTSVTPASATLARYGRFTSFSRESGIASDAAGTYTSAHRRGIAKDLDHGADRRGDRGGCHGHRDRCRRAARCAGVHRRLLGIDEAQLTIVRPPVQGRCGPGRVAGWRSDAGRGLAAFRRVVRSILAASRPRARRLSSPARRAGTSRLPASRSSPTTPSRRPPTSSQVRSSPRTAWT